MEHHQRLQRQKVDSSLERLFQRSLQASSFQTQGFGVQKKVASTPASKAELWADYQATKKMSENIIRRLPIQTKLTIGQPGDKYEQEADSVAEQVVAMSEPAQVQREELPEEEEELQMKPLAETISQLVQRQELSEEEEELQMKPEDNAIQREELPEEEEELQMKQSPASNIPVATPDLESQLSSSKGGGSPLSDDVCSFMEPRFGADFSGVRVHTGSDAVQMNRDVNAQAFAHGSDIYFGAGKTPGNNELTAHELTHVVQQTSPPALQQQREPIQAKLTVGQPGDCYEQEADRMAAQVMAMPEPASPPPVQRREAEEGQEETEEIQAKPLVDFITPLVQRSPPRPVGFGQDKPETYEPAFMKDALPGIAKVFYGLASLVGWTTIYHMAKEASRKKTLIEVMDVLIRGGIFGMARADAVAEILPQSWLIALAQREVSLKGPLARQHLDHYLAGSGTDFVEDVAALYKQDSGFKQASETAISEAGELSGQFALSQGDFTNGEWQYALGAVDEVHYKLLSAVDDVNAEVLIRIRDNYEWHPDEYRSWGSHIAHVALENAKQNGAKNFWEVGEATVSLRVGAKLITALAP